VAIERAINAEIKDESGPPFRIWQPRDGAAGAEGCRDRSARTCRGDGQGASASVGALLLYHAIVALSAMAVAMTATYI